MPTLTLEPQEACLHCGCRLRGFSIGSYRINKGSLRSNTGGAITWLECPECGPSFSRRHPLGVRQFGDRWRLDAESQAVVNAHRVRKGWAV